MIRRRCRVLVVLCLLGAAVAPAWARDGGTSGGGESDSHGSDGGASDSGGDDGNSGSGSDSDSGGDSDSGSDNDSDSGSGSDDSGSDDDGGDDDNGAGAGGQGGGHDRAVSGEVVVTAPDIDYPALRALGYPIIRERHLAALGLTMVRVRVLPPRDLDEAIAALRAALPRSEVGLNGLYGIEGASSAEPPAPLPGEFLWPGRLMGWSAAAADCAAGLHIGVIDTPLDLAAPSLHGVAIRSFGAADLDGSPASSRHGTIVASLMTGQGPLMAGLVPRAELFHAAAAQSVDGQAMASATSIAAALDWMVAENVAVVNISLAGPDTPLLREVVRRASAAGLRLVAAAGNGGPAAAPAYPASYPGVIGVTAVDRLGRLWPQSAPLAAPAVAAPGAGLAVSTADGAVEHISGTSYASPLVASLLLTVSRTLPPSDVQGRLVRGGRPTDRPDHLIPQFDAACR